MSESSRAGPRPAEPGAATQDPAVRPFRVGVAEEDLEGLRRRIDATRWPERETVHDDSQGVPLATMQDLARSWATVYDWRKLEARLNVLPQFMTELDGLDIHFLHVRSCHGDALPLIVTHGWPGSIIEQLKLIGPLTDPTAHRASEADAFDLVTPSLPGHGFSAKPTTTGWDPTRIARAWVVLMGRLGYPRFVAQGGDPPPPGLSEEERTAYAQLASFSATTWPMPPSWPPAPDPVRAGRLPGRPGRLHARPRRRDRPARPVKGVLEGTLESDLTRDDPLDHITLYWLTNTGVSAARLSWENTADFFDAKAITIPFAISVFPDEPYQAPRSWAERAYPNNLIPYHRLDRGGHFAAWEQPQLLTQELRTALRPLR